MSFFATLYWLATRLLAARTSTIPTMCVSAVAVLSLQAGISLLNPQSSFDVHRSAFLPNLSYVPFLPATVDVRTSWSFTVEMLSYLGAVLVAADLSRLPCWRCRFVGAVAFTGVAVSLAGLCLKAGCLPRLNAYLQGRPWAQGNVFGPFDYHGNAGAFLNLTLPFVAVRGAASGTVARRVAWRLSLGLVYLALVVNGSRAALIIGLFLSPLCLWIASSDGSAGYRQAIFIRPGLWKLALGAALVAVVAGGLLLVASDSPPVRRLRHLSVELREPEYPRYMQSRAAWEMVQERPWFGAGIGSYKVLVQTSSIHGYFFAPSYRPSEPFTVLGHTHEDYLQTLVEWGWVGFSGWAVLVSGAFVTLWKTFQRIGFCNRTALALGVAMLGVYLHALGDCPLQIPAIQFYVALCLGMAWGSHAWQD